MSQENDRSFFDRLGEILNAPLPGTQKPQAPRPPAPLGTPDTDEDASLLERIKEILNTPLAGAAEDTGAPATRDQQDSAREGSQQPAPASTSARSTPQPGPDSGRAAEHQGVKTPELDEDDLDEHWWKQDWAAFRSHQAQERQGLEQKQRGDLAKFVAYQDQEKRRFEAHQQQELDFFRQQQHWRLNAWKQAIVANPGSRPPPPPWSMPGAPGMMPPAGPPIGGPGPMGPPPWMRPPGRRHGR